MSVTGPFSVKASAAFAGGKINTLNTAAGAAAAYTATNLYADYGGVPAGEIVTISQSSGLTDFWGGILQLTSVKAIYLAADPENAANLIVGGGDGRLPSTTPPIRSTTRSDRHADLPGLIRMGDQPGG